MKTVPQAILKEYVKSQNFTSTGEIMEAMKEMFRDVIQTVMEVELDEELGRERCQRAEASGDRPNYRNGHTKKTVKTQLGKVEIQVPRDRNGSFEPKIIGKYSRNVDGTEEKILSLYSCGMSQRDISINEGGHMAPGGYVVQTSGDFREYYHGPQDIPAEHKVFSYPQLSIREQMAAYKEVIDGSSKEGFRRLTEKGREER